MMSAMPMNHNVKRRLLESTKKVIWILALFIYIPSPPHIIETEITPTGESRQKASADKISIKT